MSSNQRELAIARTATMYQLLVKFEVSTGFFSKYVCVCVGVCAGMHLYALHTCYSHNHTHTYLSPYIGKKKVLPSGPFSCLCRVVLMSRLTKWLGLIRSLHQNRALLLSQ